jgi:hypothetical protein
MGEENSVVFLNPVAGGNGKAVRGRQVVICLLDLHLRREEVGSGREASNGTLVAVAHGLEEVGAEVGGGSSGRVKAQSRKRVEIGGSDRGGLSRLIRLIMRSIKST